MKLHGFGFLRPYLYTSCRAGQQSRVARTFLHVGRQCRAEDAARNETADYVKRLQQLKEHIEPMTMYPRMSKQKGNVMTIPQFRRRYANVPQMTWDDEATVTIYGRVRSFRTAGKLLTFVDFENEGETFQVVVDFKRVQYSHVTEEDVHRFQSLVRRGDWYSITGRPSKLTSKVLSLCAIHLPDLLAPSLHQHPWSLKDPEKKMTRRHVDLAVNKESREVLQLRWVIENSLQTYYTELGFTKVSTPIIVAKAGGAVARPFETVASEFQDRTLQLRIAPELFLKRLVVGGLGGVYEIGPVFRNEGVDPTHNPEFTICEFYRPFASLKELIEMTESTFKRIVKAVELRREEKFPSLPAIEVEFKTPYRQLDFISTIESESGKKLPMLQGENALQELIGFCGELDIPLPAVPNVARLLEQLSEKYLEPQCIEPTFIIHHPAICSPLAKSFIDEATGQEVSARAELFINGREYVNCYEEENSPFEQRRKFEQQATRKSSAANAIAETAESRASQAEIDESYIEALEWGLPPTGGWGCGVDRLVMLFSGKSRIADVLPFGTLRNVVGAVSK